MSEPIDIVIKPEPVRCPKCKSADVKLILAAEKRDKSGFFTFKCNKCGFEFLEELDYIIRKEEDLYSLPDFLKRKSGNELYV